MNAGKKLGSVDGIKIGHTFMLKDQHPFLNHGLDGLIIVNQGGKAPLSGLLRGRNDFSEQYGEETVVRVEKIAEHLHECYVPRIARIDLVKRHFGLKCICLTPSTSGKFYYQNFNKVIWSDRRGGSLMERHSLWRDYIYAMTYYSLLLISRNHKIHITGITSLTDTGFQGSEQMADAIVNFASLNKNHSPIREIVYSGYGYAEDIILNPGETPKHRDLDYAFGHDKEFDYEFVEVNLQSPFTSLRVS
jgi:hypothetical protein